MRRLKSIYLLSVAVAIFSLLLIDWSPNHKNARPFVIGPKDLTLIAHAGSGLPQGTYANSLEAMDLAAANGFQLIEIDFSWTADEQIVAIHDWRRRYNDWFNLPMLQQVLYRFKISPPHPSLAAFNKLEMRFGLQQADLERVMRWLENHPDIRIVTDIKDNNLIALQQIAEKYPSMIPQIIPQIYAPDEYTHVMELGWRDIIFTAYRSDLTTKEIVDFVETQKLFALTIPLRMRDDGRYLAFVNLQTPVFTHTINMFDEAERLQDEGFYGLYTDYLMPQR